MFHVLAEPFAEVGWVGEAELRGDFFDREFVLVEEVFGRFEAGGFFPLFWGLASGVLKDAVDLGFGETDGGGEGVVVDGGNRDGFHQAKDELGDPHVGGELEGP